MPVSRPTTNGFPAPDGRAVIPLTCPEPGKTAWPVLAERYLVHDPSDEMRVLSTLFVLSYTAN